MTKKDFTEFCKYLGAISRIFDKQLNSEIDFELYYQALRDYPFELVREALQTAVKRHKYFPRPADVIELIEGLPDSPDSRAELAWAVVIQAIRKHGGYQSVIFDDPAITATIKAGPWNGWIGLCEKETRELNYIKSEFKNLYNYFHAVRNTLSIEVLPGIVELDCLQRGLKEAIEPPYLVRTGCRLTQKQKKELIKLIRERKAIIGFSLPLPGGPDREAPAEPTESANVIVLKKAALPDNQHGG
jgi:hypothetical protein